MGADDEKATPAAAATVRGEDETAAEAQAEGAALGLGAADETPEQTARRLERELEKQTAEAERHRDLYLRERAELENFKKRMQREKSEAIRFAGEPLVRDLLPIIDDLERAVAHAESSGERQPLVEGVRLVLKSAFEVLERHGVSRVEAGGERFDPALHEALAQIPDAEGEPNRVVEQFRPGYRLHDRLLRAAQVSVSTKPPVEKGGGDD